MRYAHQRLVRVCTCATLILTTAAKVSQVTTMSPCKALSAALGSKVSLPTDSIFTRSLESYWSQQEEALVPGCIVSPKSSRDVAVTVNILRSLNALNNTEVFFALRGGGHTPYAGSANISKGVTIDLRSVSGIEVSSDNTVTSIGGGAVWRDVYLKLSAMGLMVAGGRVSNVGVGGLTLGGGVSFFSPRKGFVCDNVVNYEVVLADGRIINANSKENSDLWVSLRGGSSNFGIVTRFDMRTFAQGNIWGGSLHYDISTAPQQLQAFANFNGASNYDEYAELIQNYAFVGDMGLYLAINSLEYTKPVAYPSVFQPFTDIQPQLFNSMRISNLTDITDELAASGPSGARQIFMTTTFRNDLSLLTSIFDLWKISTSKIGQVAGISYSLTFQVLPPSITSKSGPLGGNSLGLDPSDGPLVICLLTMTWKLVADDATVSQVGRGLINEIDKASQDKGLFSRFKYLNYADFDQSPITGYGPEIHSNLKTVSKKYDPSGFFQRAMPGGFKL